jgi:pimeloyl-ACP methyl ester carboxylesterase
MRPRFLLAAASALTALAFASPAAAWDIPPDNGTMPRAAIQEILASNDYPETGTYKQTIDFIDFSANGQDFTQVVVTLNPDKPAMRKGKKLVVVGGEPGSEYAMDFVTTVEGKEGPAIWLAKRGVTFVALTRVGRWNFLKPDGAWDTIPLDARMPMFNRAQKAPWTAKDFDVRRADGSAGASAAISGMYRYPKKGTALENQMLAATPQVFIDGYALALKKAIPDRARSLVLFWGMSTGGATLYPLAKSYTPDGFLGWGTSSTGLAYVVDKASGGDFRDVYDHSALRVRERGVDDFEFYSRNIDPATRSVWWKAAQKDPRFKSTEDETMQFGAGALTEHGLRLWQSDFLPADARKEGLAAFMRDMFEPSYPPAELKSVPVLVLNGTADEAQPPKTVDITRKVMEPYTKKYRVGRIEGLHHYLFTQDSIKIVGSTWMRYIASGFFD